MPLNEIYTALAESITGEPPNQKIDLYTAAENKPVLAPLKEVLRLFSIQTSYTLSKVNLTQNVSAVTLTGTGTFGIPGVALPNLSNVSARLVATSPDNLDQFELSLAITDPAWTFSKTFPVLPDAQQAVGQSVTYKPSFLIDLPLGKPAFTARSIAGSTLHLSGELPPAGALEQYADLFAPWPLRLDGTLEMPANPADPPTLNLTALSPTLVFQIGGVWLREVGLQFTIVNDLDVETYGRSSFSVLDLVATLYLGETDPIKGIVSTPLLASSSIWRLMVDFEDEAAPLAKGLARIALLFGVPEDLLLVPSGFDDFTGFYISEIEIGIVPPTSSEIIPSLEHIAVTLGSKKEWNPPIPYVRIRDVGTRWLLGWTTTGGQTTQYLSGCVYGGVVIGGAQESSNGGPVLRDQGPPPEALATGDAFTVDVTGLIPQFIVMGSLRTGDKISLVSAFRYFFGNPGPPAKADLAITAFDFQADPRGQTYEASATITTILSEDNSPADWAIPLGANVSITLMQLSFFINVTQGAVTGGINGEFLLAGGAPPGDPQPRFLVGAEYTGSDSADGWIFTGSLYPDTYVELVSLVSNFLGITPPSGLPTLSLERLSAQFATGSRAYSVSGTVVGRWTPVLFGNELAISASASVDLSKPAGATEAEGSLVGRFAINKIAVTVGINLRVKEPTYLFKVEFGHLWLSATTGWRGQGAQRHQILTLQLGGITLGGMLEYLINLAAPTMGFQLEPPWDILNRIDLSRFLLTIDPKESSVELVYSANTDLVFMRIDTIGVRYRRVRGESAVELVLTGKMLDRVYTTDKPLAWNVISDPPPSVPGKGTSLLDLRYIGVGQRVTFKGDLPNTVRETLDKLINDMRPVKNPNVNPLKQPSGSNLKGAPESGWLIGIDASFMETVDLGLIFNDPRIYGLSIGLRGERAGPLAGLRFEILYKKITDDIGMFRIELRLPEALRHIELGQISITLGIIVVEIYTNGNFFIDLGFPYNRNFDRSFSLLYFPFLGRGGFYFGLLDGNTSQRVPRITNGTFSPVLELGIGLAVGVGKEISAGPLSGGAFVQVEVIFQGVLGWFNPSSSGTPSAKYYWIQGIAAISGKVYGKIDFKIIKVSVTIEAYAQVSVTIEAYRPTVFRLNVGVKVKAEIEVIFFTISFSFEARLDLSFTVGSVQPTPWILASGQGTTTQARQRGNILPPLARDPARRINALRTQHLIELQRAGAIRALPHPGASMLDPDTPYVLNWDPHTKVFTDSPRHIPMTMLPAFSLTAVPVNWDGTQPDNPNPQYRVAFLLFAPNGVQPRALDSAGARVADLSAHANTTGELSSDTLIEALLRWSISAITGTPGNNPAAVVTAGQLHTLKEQMDRAETPNEGFSKTNLGIFFDANLWLQISGDPGGAPNLQGGTALPIPPFLSWTSPQAGDRNFATDDPVGPLYEWGASKFISQYFPLEAPAGPPPPDDPTKYESFATFIFRDWSLMVAKAAVQAAFDAMQNWVVQVTGPTSLADVAGRFPTAIVEYAIRSGDTIDSVAASLGATPAELEYLNPNLPGELASAPVGTKIQIVLGIVPEVVAIDNSGVALVPGVKLELGTVAYQVAQGDTLSSVATRFGLTGPVALFNGTGLADDPRLLRAGAEFEAPQTVYEPPAGLSTLLTAAIFYVRYYGPTGVPYADWYTQTIFELNADGALAGFDYDQPLPPGTIIKVPPALNDTSPADAINYTTLPGDMLTRIGSALSLEQNFGTGSGPDQQWPVFRDKVQPVTGRVQLPSTTVAIQPGETVNLLAARTIVNYDNLAGLLGWVGGAKILGPLAVVSVPTVSATTGTDGGTLAELATHFGLTVEDLASRIPNDNIFTGSQAQPLELTIAHLPAQRIDAVVENVLGGKEPAQICGMSSRYLLSGLSLPAPQDDEEGHKVASGPLTSLYDLTGLQFAGPVPDLAKPTEVALSVTVTVNAGTQWIQLMDSTTVGEGEGFEALVARAPRVRELNRALADEARLRPGMVVYTDPTPSLVFSYTNEQLGHNYPATGLGILPFVGPMALPLSGQAPKTYGLDHRVELQSPIALPIPTYGTAPLTGNASLWPFPSALLAHAQAGSPTPFEIVRTNNRPDAGAEPDTVQGSTFATLLPFRIRRLEEADHVYELQGADTANRQVLLWVWQYLNNPNTPPGTKAFLLLAPAPNADNPSGLSVLLADNAKTFLVKTNEATETAPGAAQKRRQGETAPPPTASQYYASFGDLAQFAVLLWEGSVVGGTGYFLGCTTIDGQELPASAFDERGNATLYLLVVAGEQQALAPGGRRLLTFNNCALIAPGLDPSTNALFAEAADDSDLITQPLVPPGNVGFRLLLNVPVQPPDGRSPEVQLQQLFSLSTYEVPAIPGSPFQMNPPGLPVGPQDDDGRLTPIYQRRRLARWRRDGRSVAEPPETGDFWRYEQVLPISHFGPGSTAPSVSGLPVVENDPYRGIGGQTLSSAVIQLGFADVLGNVTAPPAQTEQLPPGAISAPVGYTDQILGVSNWPALTTSYAISASNSTVNLTVTIAPQPAAIAPSPNQPPRVAIDAASRQAGKYEQAYFQLVQPNVTAWILSSLKQDASGQPTPLETDSAWMWRFAAASYAASQAAASVTPATASGTIGEMVNNYGLTFEGLAQANADQPIIQIFGPQPLVVPAFVIFADGDTADGIVNNASPGWPKPSSGAALLALPENAGVLPLRPGVTLSISALSIVVPPGTPTAPLEVLAEAHGTTASLLASDNSATEPLLRNGFVFQMDGLAVTVGVTKVKKTDKYVTTFADVQQAFAEVGVNASVGDIGAANASMPDMLIEGKTLFTKHYITKADETLMHNESGVSTEDLAAKNEGTANLFDAGALVYMGNFSPDPVIQPDDPQTLREFADRYACPLTLLLEANTGLSLPPETTLVIPGTVSVPQGGAGIWIPYTIGGVDTLDGVAGKFAPLPGAGTPAVNLATADFEMPATIAGGQTVSVTVGGQTYSTQTQDGDSFRSVLERLQSQLSAITLADLVNSISSKAGYLAAGGLLICPPCVLPVQPALADGTVTPAYVQQIYGVTAGAFAQANAGVLGLISGDKTLYNKAGTVSVTTRANDTFNSIISRFAAKDPQMGMAELVDANLERAFLKSGGLALLPPTPINLEVSLGTTAGPFAAPMFPLTVALRIQRPEAVVDPEFRTSNQDGPTERADTIVPAPSSPQGQGRDASLTLAEFARAFNAAFHDLRLATGKVAGTDADLWVVSFTADGIAAVKVAPGVVLPSGERWPRFFALRPLYNDLVTRPRVSVRTLEQDGKLSETVTPTDYQAVDVEIWARRFLADVDLFLTAPYATGVYSISSARGSLDRVLEAKQRLSKAIANGIAAVLVLEDPDAQSGRQKAADALQQQLAVTLSRAYDTAAIVQYDAKVTSAWTEGAQLKPARLMGTAEPLPPEAEGGEPDPTDLPFTLTGAKTNLDKARSFVNFLMRVPDPAHHGSVVVNLDYDFLDLEFNISSVEGVAGYQASDWLSFVPPLAGKDKPAGVQTTLGRATVPIPLRAYPALPVLLGQYARATYDSQTTLPRSVSSAPPLAQTPLWTYGLTYSHEHAEQDEVFVTARFNIPPKGLLAAREEPEDVATALAKYIAVADDLWALLAGLANPSGGGDLQVLTNAAATFDTLVSGVAAAWEGRWPPQADTGTSSFEGSGLPQENRADEMLNAPPPPQSYDFRVRFTYRRGEDGKVYFDSLHLASSQDKPGPMGLWPDASCRAPDGKQTHLIPGQPEQRTLIYKFPDDEPIPAEQWPEITLEWGDLNVAALENATASLAVRRNQKLLGDGGPDTAADFLYQTPTIDAVDIVTPLNSWPQRIDITGPGIGVADALRVAFNSLFGATTGLPITIGILYGYELVPPSEGDDEGLVTYLPVSLYPDQVLGPDTPVAIENALTQWRNKNLPASQGGEWAFSLTLYSQLDPGARRPLLVLDRLVYRISV